MYVVMTSRPSYRAIRQQLLDSTLCPASLVPAPPRRTAECLARLYPRQVGGTGLGKDFITLEAPRPRHRAKLSFETLARLCPRPLGRLPAPRQADRVPWNAGHGARPVTAPLHGGGVVTTDARVKSGKGPRAGGSRLVVVATLPPAELPRALVPGPPRALVPGPPRALVPGPPKPALGDLSGLRDR